MGSVSKDRIVALYKKNEESGKFEYFCSDSSHSRIIRALSFSNDDKWLCTGARDKKIKIFGIN